MNVTGLIYVAIVALWAAVLIPMWLRRHDDDQARRIERHRVAMGTLARIADDPEEVRGAAARRRRLVIAGAATVGALGSVAWVAGLVPGLAAAASWLPLVIFVPAAIVSERRSARRAATRALQDRRERRHERVAREATQSESVATEVVAPVPRTPAAPIAWDEVFDQTA